ncbi:hypothetical protein L914_01765 [Phytophthora nicotianae]|uniref:Uncharacterized protein n=1 Tax=Phytophthora nicotianae TaxID=4792 RepID=W2P4T6_PHYNI|nr:hypothetical protein L914_01765 [Phytophthora nicotianae]
MFSEDQERAHRLGFGFRGSRSVLVYIHLHARVAAEKSEGFRKTSTPAYTANGRFVVQWQNRQGIWQLGVKLGRFYHNHSVLRETYATYPCARGVSDVVVAPLVEGMLAVGAKRSKIFDYLLEHEQNVIKADVDNMVQAFASSVSSLDDKYATAAEVGALDAADPMNCTSIAETENGETGVISLGTACMRQMFSRLGEVLLVECTRKPNR